MHNMIAILTLNCGMRLNWEGLSKQIAFCQSKFIAIRILLYCYSDKPKCVVVYIYNLFSQFKASVKRH